MTIATMQSVVEELRAHGLCASLEYPGWIQVLLPCGGIWIIGGANETIAIDAYDDLDAFEAGLDPEVLESTIPSDSDDVGRIALHIRAMYCGVMRVAP